MFISATESVFSSLNFTPALNKSQSLLTKNKDKLNKEFIKTPGVSLTPRTFFTKKVVDGGCSVTVAYQLVALLAWVRLPPSAFKEKIVGGTHTIRKNWMYRCVVNAASTHLPLLSSETLEAVAEMTAGLVHHTYNKKRINKSSRTIQRSLLRQSVV